VVLIVLFVCNQAQQAVLQWNFILCRGVETKAGVTPIRVDLISTDTAISVKRGQFRLRLHPEESSVIRAA
jgi:hypothetical protein